MVESSRRGGNSGSSLATPTVQLKNVKDVSSRCSCPVRCDEYFCKSSKCRNDQRDRPTRSVTNGRVCTDEGSPKSTIIPTRSEASLQPKPSEQDATPPIGHVDTARNTAMVLKHLQDKLAPANKSTNTEILESLKLAARALEIEHRNNYWTTDAGQEELLRRYEATSKPPPAGQYSSGLSVFDYTPESKMMLSATTASGSEVEGEWIEVELTADTGACDTVIPKAMCASIPIMASLQSLRGMEYEVANGESIPNLGERRCLMWTEDAKSVKHINMQVADVHKALLSLSRCADMGFESRFGRTMGALIDEDTGEVIPLRRKGNLYVLRCWLKAAPFGRQEGRG